jgi:hypothetical protein
MILEKYKLDGVVSKATEDVRLWQTERGVVEIKEDTLATSIILGDQQRGYVFHGQGKLLIYAIVETEQGAIGKSIDKELNDPFLMLGETEEIQKHLAEASEEDLEKMGYEQQKGFVDRAEDLCNRFFKKGRVHDTRRFNGDRGFIFAFQNEANKFDVLVSKGSKLIYKAMDMVFVSKKDRVLLKSQGDVVCKSNGKSVIIKKDKSIIINK